MRPAAGHTIKEFKKIDWRITSSVRLVNLRVGTFLLDFYGNWSKYHIRALLLPNCRFRAFAFQRPLGIGSSFACWYMTD
jgi:hypothetical protein